ncbi:alpha-L-rhamnosidase [Flammeovirgaceae bacterium 311]|nr:alpha-L-rhamnosidase [Flammeovirgaceae bacterium 311]
MKILIKLILLNALFATQVYGAINPPENLRVDYNTTPMGIDNPEPGFSWEPEDVNRSAVQSAYRLIVSSTQEKLDKNEGDLWDSGKRKSNQTIQVIYRGKPLQSNTRYFWKVQSWNGKDEGSEFSPPAWFHTGLFNTSDWKGIWITDGMEFPKKDEGFYDKIPSPLFRKSFSVSKEVKRASLFISGLGYYEAFLNGKKVGDHRLDPGWTQYAKTVYYAAYDVTPQIQKGENAIGAMLGNGWYNPLPMKMFGRWNLREFLTIGKPKLLAQLEIEYTDGSRETVVTDKDWKASGGPVVKNNVYLGEWYDARLEKEGWQKAGYRDAKWQKVQPVEAPAGTLTWQYIPAIKQTKTIIPKAISSPAPNTYVVDMGQNFAGVIKMKMTAPAGTEIRFRYAELLYKDGNLDFRTTAAAQIKKGGIQGGPGAPETAWQEDHYYSKGQGVEIFEPRFTFHGFRYVEITGLPYKPSLNDIEGIRLNSDLPDNASFQSSNQLFNKVQEMAEWTMLSNVYSVESDCPAREKFGYGGDMVTAGETYMYNYDMANFYAKAVRDFTNDALPSGAMTECAPNIGINARGVVPGTGPVGWTLAHPFLVEKLYKYYGNLELVKEQYQPMKDLVNFYREHVPNHIITVGIGDHVSIDERPTPVTSTAFYYHHARILSDMARLLGKKKDAQTYNALAEDIKQAFIKEFVDEKSGKVYTHTQAAQVFALYYDLVPENTKNQALQVLKDEIFMKHKGHLSTGIFSTKMMLNYLSDQNLDEVSYSMMNQKEYPGFGYMVNNGATTLWENWAFKTGDSKNHPMFGSISEWFHKSLLGIQQSDSSVAFSDIVIKPSVVGGLSWAKGHYQSVRGRISSNWWKFGDDLHLSIEIPANTRATVYVPAISIGRHDIYEGQSRLISEDEESEKQDDIRFIRKEPGYFVFSVGSGQYDFVVRQ